MGVVLEKEMRVQSDEEPRSYLTAPVTLVLPTGFWSDQDFLAICQANEAIRLERNGNGDLIMTPGDAGASRGNADIVGDLVIWNRRTKTGYVTESSAMYELPNGALYAPDAAWSLCERWDALTPEQERFPTQLVPDFVVELMSPSDRLGDARAKMREYRDNGVRLGWLINPRKKQVEIYELGKEPQILSAPKTVSGHPVLADFTADLTEIWAKVPRT